MAKLGALLLLLAVASSQVDLSLSVQSTSGDFEMNINRCPITYFGRTYTLLDLSYRNQSAAVCFKNSTEEATRDCLLIKSQDGATHWDVTLSSIQTNIALANMKSASTCSIYLLTYRPGQPAVNNDRRYSVSELTSRRLSITVLLQLGFTPSQIQNGLTVQDFLNKGLSSYTMQSYGFTVRSSIPSKYYLRIVLYQAGEQTGLGLRRYSSYQTTHVNTSVIVDGTVLRTHSDVLSSVAFLDLSGCKHPDYRVPSGVTKRSPETCSSLVCNATADLSTVSKCGVTEICQGSDTCSPAPVVCTVTGSTVIDFFNRNHSITDRCVYSLSKPQGDVSFELLAGFQERRRQDVMFLDHLILWLKSPDVKVYLEQGGRVRIDDQILTLTAAAQTHHGVELSRDRTGVTAKLPSVGMTVFFDGNTAHVAGPIGPVEGLCGNSTDPSQTTTPVKSSSYSASGCETQQSDPNASTANCSRITEHCNLMYQAPFTACHSHVAAEKYIAACTNTLCKYPAVDNLKCQFLEAYDRACKMKKNITLDDWRSNARCSARPQAFCQDQYCSAHEFCGENQDGIRCFCRATFAAKYKPTDALGEPTVCTQNSATLTLAGCLLEDKGINHTTLHLKDKNCKGHMDSKTHMVAFSFDTSNTCGTDILMQNNTQVVFKNTIMARNTSDVIIRQDQIAIDFSCIYSEPKVQSVSFRIKDSSVVQQIVSGVWNYTLTMNAYTDAGRTGLVGPNTDIQLNQRIWVELKTERLDDQVVALVTDSCWATNQQDPNDDPRYDLIKNKCPDPADRTVKVEGNGQGTSNSFSFNMFEFAGKDGKVYLHCKLELCIKQGNSCAPTCSGGAARKRRSFRSADENPAFISMVWTN